MYTIYYLVIVFEKMSSTYNMINRKINCYCLTAIYYNVVKYSLEISTVSRLQSFFVYEDIISLISN